MLAVIFEVYPAAGKTDEYLEIAAELRQQLKNIEGFITIERFKSLSDEEKILSISFWENEVSIKKWRNLEAHRAAQSKGRTTVFSDYRLRVCEVIRDYSMENRDEAPADSKDAHSES